jgi:hypothetical protein
MVQVTFMHSLSATTSESFTTFAFWDGGTTFRFRAAFPSASSTDKPWHWISSCVSGCSGDTGLAPQSGDVVVGAYTTSGASANRLYKGGFPRAGAGRHYLSLANGLSDTALLTPFFWLGDTAWSSSVRAVSQTPTGAKKEWENYVDDRKSKGFTVIQMALPVDYMSVGATANGGQPRDTNLKTPFSASSGVIPNNGSQWTPAYWQTFEQKIEYANEQGLVVLLDGLMERVIEGNKNYPAIADQKTYARNVVARLAGNFVVFSPGFDRDPADLETPKNPPGCTTNCRHLSDRIRDIITEIRQTSSRHLVTNHFAGGLPDTSAMVGFQSDVDFQFLQSGHAGFVDDTGNHQVNQSNQLRLITQRAREMPKALYEKTPTKAVINGETIYDGGPAPCKLCTNTPVCACCTCANCCPNHDCPCPVLCSTSCSLHFNDYRARQAAYLSLLSGASGYALGARGVFDWGISGTPQAGLTRASSGQMKNLRDFFVNASNFKWQNLTPNVPPEPDRLRNQASAEHLKMVVARDGFDAILAYLPDNDQVKINVGGFANFFTNNAQTAATWFMKWFNPRNGSYQNVNQWGCANETVSGIAELNCFFKRPAPAGDTQTGTADWVLLLKRGAIVTTPPPINNSLQTWAEVNADGLPVIYAQFYDGEGGPVGEPIQVSDKGDPTLKGKPRLAREPVHGGYLVVWQSEPEEGARSVVMARSLDSAGVPIADPFAVSPPIAEDQVDPAVASTPAGGFVVAWAGRDLEAGTTEVVARSFDVAGKEASSEIIQVASASEVALEAPRVSTDGNGNFVVAWESTSEVTGTTSVLARKFASSGAAQTDPIQTSPLQKGMALHLDQVEILSTGEVLITWEEVDSQGVSQGLYARPYNDSGTPTGDILTVYNSNGGDSSF